MTRLVLLSVTAILVVGACTTSDDGGPGDKTPSDKTPSDKPGASSTSPRPEGPDCVDIWKAGATLPEDYTKCVTDGTAGSQDVTDCKDGSILVAYADTYFAVTGGTIRKPKIAPMQDTEEFGKAFSACTG